MIPQKIHVYIHVNIYRERQYIYIYIHIHTHIEGSHGLDVGLMEHIVEVHG